MQTSLRRMGRLPVLRDIAQALRHVRDRFPCPSETISWIFPAGLNTRSTQDVRCVSGVARGKRWHAPGTPPISCRLFLSRRGRFPRFYSSKVVKPNGTRARSAMSLYRCRRLSISDNKKLFPTTRKWCSLLTRPRRIVVACDFSEKAIFSCYS